MDVFGALVGKCQLPVVGGSFGGDWEFESIERAIDHLILPPTGS